MLLEAASDDIPEPDNVRRLMRDLREVRMAKMRAGVSVLEGGKEVKMNGVGGMEVAEGRAFIGGVVDGLRYERVLGLARVMVADQGPEKSAPQRSYRGKRGRLKKERTVLAVLRTRKTRTRWITSADAHSHLPYERNAMPCYAQLMHPPSASTLPSVFNAP